MYEIKERLLMWQAIVFPIVFFYTSILHRYSFILIWFYSGTYTLGKSDLRWSHTQQCRAADSYERVVGSHGSGFVFSYRY